MHAGSEFSIILPGCTSQKCKLKCLEFAKKEGTMMKMSYCETPNGCDCILAPKQRLPLTTEVKGLADAEDDNGTFV
jgi:hypothetical protein